MREIIEVMIGGQVMYVTTTGEKNYNTLGSLFIGEKGEFCLADTPVRLNAQRVQLQLLSPLNWASGDKFVIIEAQHCPFTSLPYPEEFEYKEGKVYCKEESYNCSEADLALLLLRKAIRRVCSKSFVKDPE